jgi:hypothetical protein
VRHRRSCNSVRLSCNGSPPELPRYTGTAASGSRPSCKWWCCNGPPPESCKWRCCNGPPQELQMASTGDAKARHRVCKGAPPELQRRAADASKTGRRSCKGPPPELQRLAGDASKTGRWSCKLRSLRAALRGAPSCCAASPTRASSRCCKYVIERRRWCGKEWVAVL